jgi:hypothetical protein
VAHPRKQARLGNGNTTGGFPFLYLNGNTTVILSVFWTGNLPRGVPEVDECGLAEIDNSKEETRSIQFRQVRAARCVIPYVLYAA